MERPMSWGGQFISSSRRKRDGPPNPGGTHGGHGRGRDGHAACSGEEPARDLEKRLQQFRALPGTTSSASISAATRWHPTRRPPSASSPAPLRLSSLANISATSRRAVSPRMNSYPWMTASAPRVKPCPREPDGHDPGPLGAGGDDHPQRQHGNRHRPAPCWSRSRSLLDRHAGTGCNAYSKFNTSFLLVQ